ncbi:MAG TPA: thioesterase family protein [Thermodesulfobacteriota bacterium]
MEPVTEREAGAGRAGWPSVRAVASAVVPYADTDAQGRVYYGHYARYLDEGRFRLWTAAGFDEAELRRLEHATVLARLEIDYRGPAEFHDRLRVAVGIESIGRTSLVLRYAVTHADGRPVLDARQVLVHVDLAAGGRPVPWTSADRARLDPLVG